MSFPGNAWRKLIFFLRRDRLDRELQEEMQQHLAMKVRANADAGMSAEEASVSARRELGNVTRLREESRRHWSFPRFESWLQDLRYGLRGLRKAPAFTAVAVITLGLGIGATATIFSVVDTVLLKPLPYRDSGRLVQVSEYSPIMPGVSMPLSQAELDKLQSIQSMKLAGYEEGNAILTGNLEPERISTAAISPELLPLLGVQPAEGRVFDASDIRDKREDLVLLGHALWQRKFGGDRGIVGKTIILDQKPCIVIGILPPGFRFPGDAADLWTLIPKPITSEVEYNTSVVGRLNDSATLRTAQAELDVLMGRMAKARPEEEGVALEAVSLQQEVAGSSKKALLILLGAVGFVLLIACVNVSNLILARGLGRHREIAMRAALGASRGRIVRQLLIESLLLSSLGGIAGSLLALWGVPLVRLLAPGSTPRLDELSVDPMLAGFALALSVVTGTLAGLVPAFYSSQIDLNSGLKNGQVAAHGRPITLPNLLVVAEVALALVLLTGSALMGQSLYRLLTVDTGLRTDHLLALQLSLPLPRYPTPAGQALFASRLLASLGNHPGISGVALTDNGLLNGGSRTFRTNGTDFRSRALNQSEMRAVTPEFFSLLGIRLRAGRLLNEDDRGTSEKVAVINETLARSYFRGEDPLDRVLRMDGNRRYRIVGVVSDTRDVALRSTPVGEVYLPFAQNPSTLIYAVARTGSDPMGQAADVRSLIQALDKNQPITGMRSMDQVISKSVSGPRFRAGLLSSFAGLGLLLTLTGIYGVVGYSVTRKTREIGIRMALGAERRNVMNGVLGQGARLAAIGVVIGVAGSLAVTRVLAGELFGIKPGDPVTLIATTLLMMVVALAASWMPARRATRVDPMVALRQE